jgi:hypothetical protein
MMQFVQSIAAHDVEKRCTERIRQGWRVAHVCASGGFVHVVFEKEQYAPPMPGGEPKSR